MPNPQETAELAIAAILRDLEVETNTLVERISIQSLEITSLRDDREQWLRRVDIDLRPQLGTRWRAG